MSKSPCQVCLARVHEITKRFDPLVGYVCVECYEFMGYADKALRKHGVEGSITSPQRQSPKPQDP